MYKIKELKTIYKKKLSNSSDKTKQIIKVNKLESRNKLAYNKLIWIYKQIHKWITLPIK